MARIRSKGNKDTEVALAGLLRTAGIKGWRRHSEIRIPISDLRGKAAAGAMRLFKVRPDFVWRKERVVVFVDGCFWHGCPWHGTKPSSNKSFWREKLAQNKERDRRGTRLLRRNGWLVLRIWEHTLPRAARDAVVLGKLLERIRKGLKR